MATGYDIGGGGGVASSVSSSTRIAFDKPYDISAGGDGQFTAEMAEKIDEMFRLLFQQSTQTEDTIDEDLVVGPASATDGNLAVFDGTTGKLIRDGGALGGTILVSIDLTEAQLESLSTVPITVITAPGAGLVAVPIMWTYQINVSVVYTNAPSAVLRYTGNGSNLANTIGSRASSLGISHATAVAQAFAEGAGTFDPRNKAVEVLFDAALTGTGTATAKITAIYYIADFS